ncbi:isochorismatase family cysteine hydrolase [Lentibacillus sp.]|uniref:isochorismatase family cysteine hydrolase n=1 Tax=Lentibacillus sp. TaxID=1925746 RepID=UPI002B4ADBD6|nr:isochorismatase family cysteine hydrolase [Lentibacillus sp.]HLS08955.1 isochorismatase family cysteine hydrolase [Lentibacillus sp.]
MDTSIDNSAILFIDIINDFNFDGSGKLLKYTETILPDLKRLRQFGKENDIPIIYINDHYGTWHSDFRKILNHCQNSRNRHIIHEIKPDDSDYFLIKPQHSAFFQTPLHALLNDLGRTHLIMAGIAGDICILFTAKDAYMYKYTMHIPENCMASEEKDGNEYALYLMRSVMDAVIDPI